MHYTNIPFVNGMRFHKQRREVCRVYVDILVNGMKLQLFASAAEQKQSNRSTSETTARQIAKGDGLATLFCHRKLDMIEELELKLKLVHVRAPESRFTTLVCT